MLTYVKESHFKVRSDANIHEFSIWYHSSSGFRQLYMPYPYIDALSAWAHVLDQLSRACRAETYCLSAGGRQVTISTDVDDVPRGGL